MKKTFLLLFAVASCIFCAYGQNDSISFVSGDWTSSQVADGVVLKQCHFNAGELFGGSNQFVSVMEIAPARHVHVVTAPEGTLKHTTAIAEESGALAALNGSFFKMRAPYGGVTYTRVNGEAIDANSNDGDPVRSYRQNGAVVVRDGKTYILKADRLRSWENYISADDVMTSGPIMIVDGEDVDVPQKSFNTYRHPRTAVGKRVDGTILFVVVDGRAKESSGVSIFELRQIMRWLGCKDALNLDGGGSSTLTAGSMIVNRPCDNKKFDNEGERKVANALIVL